jgi:hypothetical protein
MYIYIHIYIHIPKARVVVTTISIAIGMEATIKTTVNEILSFNSTSDTSKNIKTMPESTKDKTTKMIIILNNIFCRLPDSPVPWSREAVLPKNVLEPVEY